MIEVFTVEMLWYLEGGNVETELVGAFDDMDDAREWAMKVESEDAKLTCWHGADDQWAQLRSEWE